MNIRLPQITEGETKSLYTEKVLLGLPEWFGNDRALQDYAASVADLPFWAALDSEDSCVGFVAVKVHHEHTGDIYVLGILPGYHNLGIGKQLMATADEYFV